jgi:hypothetical protein
MIVAAIAVSEICHTLKEWARWHLDEDWQVTSRGLRCKSLRPRASRDLEQVIGR